MFKKTAVLFLSLALVLCSACSNNMKEVKESRTVSYEELGITYTTPDAWREFEATNLYPSTFAMDDVFAIIDYSYITEEDYEKYISRETDSIESLLLSICKIVVISEDNAESKNISSLFSLYNDVVKVGSNDGYEYYISYNYIGSENFLPEKDKALPFTPSGVAAIIQYASAIADSQDKICTKYNDLLQILTESVAWAEADKAEAVEEKHVKQAVIEKRNRVNNYDKRMQEMILDNTIMVDTNGAVVGQINGLSVIDMGDCTFGKPSRITANTFIGKSGIVNIEREADMSGTSHTKGVLIISAYIGEKYAQNLPLALTASLCFEQLYSGVDGDSASSTEIYAILSSLSGVPIKQGIAVTGSVNQKGEIQPIGGASDKIDGFFQVCKARKLTGEQGVIIPYQNIKNLHLRDEIIEAVKEGKFHIWAVKTIDEGIEILTGVKAGKKKKDGTYPEGTINCLAYNKLKDYAMTVVNFGKEENTIKY